MFLLGFAFQKPRKNKLNNPQKVPNSRAKGIKNHQKSKTRFALTTKQRLFQKYHFWVPFPVRPHVVPCVFEVCFVFFVSGTCKYMGVGQKRVPKKPYW